MHRGAFEVLRLQGLIFAVLIFLHCCSYNFDAREFFNPVVNCLFVNTIALLNLQFW